MLRSSWAARSGVWAFIVCTGVSHQGRTALVWDNLQSYAKKVVLPPCSEPKQETGIKQLQTSVCWKDMHYFYGFQPKWWVNPRKQQLSPVPNCLYAVGKGTSTARRGNQPRFAQQSLGSPLGPSGSFGDEIQDHLENTWEPPEKPEGAAVAS